MTYTCQRCDYIFIREKGSVLQSCPLCKETVVGEKKMQPNDLNETWEDVIKIPRDTRNRNVGESDYAQHNIQPWDIWKEYKLNPFDADIVKRVLRTKKGECRTLDYKKIIHICQERLNHFKKENGIYIDTVFKENK